jgi:NADH:ubiquinone oxidoreductase subunit F (NADH-binding)
MQAAGGLTLPAAGVLLGGYGGAWIAGAHLESLRLSDERLAPFGASLGAGVVAVLSAHACPVRELARLTRWLAGQSAGQCGPCVHGLDALAGGFEAIAAGAPRGNGEQRMRQLAALVRARGACAHPDGVARMALSALAAFPTELAEHARHGPCERCARSPELPLARA